MDRSIVFVMFTSYTIIVTVYSYIHLCSRFMNTCKSYNATIFRYIHLCFRFIIQCKHIPLHSFVFPFYHTMQTYPVIYVCIV